MPYPSDELTISEIIKQSVKNTVGYAEATNKDSFMVGAQVAFKLSEEYYNKEMKQLIIHSNFNENRRKSAEGDLKNLASIISKYQE